MNSYHITIIKQALDHPGLLSEWEDEFINNIAERDDDYNLSEKQIEVLNKIEHKIALG